ncbi:MAG: threonine ammonia-lyase [Methanoregula sp.]|nr:threonine ammonia-lyase [Methanoregula sp.]
MVSLADIRYAQVLIAPHIIRTPLVHSPTISALTGAQVYLKLETLQKAGSFKVRGASYKIFSSLEQCKEHGVVAASAGNHAQGVAIAARSAGVPATIVMPEWSSIAKQEATRGYGAEVIITGLTLDESIEQAQEIARDGGLFIHPYDDDGVITGQGTIALEILQDLPDADMIVVPVGGGGLIAGIAIAAKGLRPDISIIGAQAKACPSAYEAMRHLEPVRVDAGRTIADGIRVIQTGTETLPVIRELVDMIALATEEEIADAMLLLMERKHVIAEGAGATPLAALLNGSIPVKPGSKVVLVISGGNVDSPQLFRILKQALLRHGRIIRLSVLLDDRPGTLARLLFTIAKEQGNILSIQHIQGESDSAAHQARVELELETRGMAHADAIKKALGDQGYDL